MPDRPNNLHRNNAAEWAMWVCLLPVWLVLIGVRRIKGRN
jgi:hypothetical protein